MYYRRIFHRAAAAIILTLVLVGCTTTPALRADGRESLSRATTTTELGRSTPVPASPVPSSLDLPLDKVWLGLLRSLPPSVAVYYPAVVPRKFGTPTTDETDGDLSDEPSYTIIYKAREATLVFIRGTGAGALGNLPALPATYSETLMVGGKSASLTVIPSQSPPSQVIDLTWSDDNMPYYIRCFGNGCTVDDIRHIATSVTRLTKDMLGQ